jgi:hypothetical protein
MPIVTPPSVDPFFLEYLGLLRIYALNAATSAAGTGIRSWALPRDNDPTASPWDHGEIAASFDRSGVNAAYAAAMLGTGSLGDVASANLQGDHLAAAERAYRLRSAGRVRLGMWRGARQNGHAGNAGILARLGGEAQDLIAAGVDADGQDEGASDEEVLLAEQEADRLNDLAEAAMDFEVDLGGPNDDGLQGGTASDD